MSDRRARLLPLIGLSCLVALTGCSTSAGSTNAHVQDSCDAARTAPFDCHVFVSTSAADPTLGRLTWVRSDPVRVWLEPLNGRLTLVAIGPVNTTNVALDVDGATAVVDSASAATSDVGCGESAQCEHDAWLSRLLGGRTTVAAHGAELILTGDRRKTLVLRISGEVPPR